MTEATKITYDVSDAIAKLNQLNKKVGEAGDKVVEAFSGAATSALDTFEDGLSNISPIAGKVVGGIRGIASSLGPMGLVAGTAAAGIAAVVSNLVDLPGLLRDSAAGMDAFNEAVDRQFRLREQAGDLNDEAELAKFDRALRKLRVQKADVSEEQIRVSDLQSLANEELRIAQDVLRAKESALKDSVRKRTALERELSDRVGDSSVRDVEASGRTKGRAVGELASAAQQAALKGNTEQADKYLQRAQEIADELGGHVFFQKQIDQANAAITEQLKTQVGDQKKIESALENDVKLARQKADELERGLAALKEEQRILANRQKAIGAETRRTREGRTEFERTDAADTAAGEFNAAVVKIRREFEAGGRTLGENIKDSLKLGFSSLGSKARVDAGLDTEAQALRSFGELSKILLKPEGVTAQDVQGIQPLIQKVGELVGALEVAEREGTLSGGQTHGLDQLQRLLTAAEQATKATIEFRRADRSDTEVIRPGSRAQSIDLGERIEEGATSVDLLNESALKATDTLTRLANTQIPAAQTPAAQLATAAAPQSPAAPIQPLTQAASVINVNATVRGGLIDREVTEQITEIIRRELRKQTGNSVA